MTNLSKVFYIIFLELLLGCGQRKSNEKLYYYSVMAWVELNYSNHSNPMSDFYDFQYHVKDSVQKGQENHAGFIDERLFKKFLRDSVLKYDYQLPLLERIGKLQANTNRDSTITIIDLTDGSKDSISLLSFGNAFATQAWGKSHSGRENYLIRQRSNNIEVIDILPPGNLRGVWCNTEGRIKKVVFYDFKTLYIYNDVNIYTDIMFEFDVNEDEIKFSKILNVRNGEPFDNSDNLDCLSEIKNYSYKFDKHSIGYYRFPKSQFHEY